MTSPKARRNQVRPVDRASIAEKQFRRVFITSKRVASGKVHPKIVLADLREGSLAALNRYLAQEGGIPDRAVAVELRKLIAGSVHRSRYRLEVIEHPNRKKSEGGRPASVQNKDTSERYRKIWARYEQALELAGERATAELDVAIEFKCDTKTVRRAVTTVEQELKKAQDQVHREELGKQASATLLKRRDNALQNLRESRKYPRAGGKKT